MSVQDKLNQELATLLASVPSTPADYEKPCTTRSEV